MDHGHDQRQEKWDVAFHKVGAVTGGFHSIKGGLGQFRAISGVAWRITGGTSEPHRSVVGSALY